MQSGVQILDFNVYEFRARIAKMSDEKLREFGQAARYMCSPKAMIGKPPQSVYDSVRRGYCRVAAAGLRKEGMNVFHSLLFQMRKESHRSHDVGGQRASVVVKWRRRG